MNVKKIILATAAGASLLAALPASAHGWDHRSHRPYYYYPAPAYVYYPAQPAVVAPPPAVYAPPAPVIYGRIPVRPGVTVGFGVRL